MIKYISSLTIILPLLCAALVFSFTYSVDSELYILCPVFLSFLVIFGLDLFLGKRVDLHANEFFIESSNIDEKLKKIMLLFSIFIIGMGIFDLYHHGIVFFNPDTYATFTPLQARIRNFSSLCWVLFPLAIICKFHWSFRILLAVWSVSFPIIVYDRNRLLMSFFALAVTVLFMQEKKGLKKTSLALFSALIIGSLFFVVVGNRRSGNFGVLEHYATGHNEVKLETPCDVPNHIPVKDQVKTFNPAFQWIFLYTTSPIYNLGVQFKCKVQDSSLLKAQIIPLWKRDNPVGQPFLVSSGLNVGTEILPFYMALGVSGIFLVFILEFFILRFFMIKFVREKSLINFLIFLRLAYCAFFLGFAPQFFIWTNLGFVLVMKSLELFYKSRISNFLIK